MRAMAGMERHQTPGSTASATASPQACGHGACAPQPALLAGRTSALAHATSGTAIAPPGFVLFTAAALVQSRLVRGPPLLCASSPVSLHTTLRI